MDNLLREWTCVLGLKFVARLDEGICRVFLFIVPGNYINLPRQLVIIYKYINDILNF